MKQTFLRLVLFGSVALPLGIATGSAVELKPQDTMNEQVSNAHRETQILTAFRRDPHLQAFDFSVSVDADRVVLRGIVDADISRNLAEQVAINVDGIKFVVNHIVVDAGYVRPQSTTRARGRVHDPVAIRSGTATDSRISSEVKSSLLVIDGMNSLEITVTTLDGVVTLRGVVAGTAEREVAVRAAQEIRGVTKVDASGLMGLREPARHRG